MIYCSRTSGSSQEAPHVPRTPENSISAVECLGRHLVERQAGESEYTRVSFRGPHGQVGNRDRTTHQFHWYPAKMFYRIPSQILDTLQLPRSSVILDPFCGSGTVLVEAITRGYKSVGLDTHPIARLISRAKTTPLATDRLEKYAACIASMAKSLKCSPPELRLPSFWFTSNARDALFRLYLSIDERVHEPEYRDFFLTTLTSIVRRSSLADPDVPPPVKMRPERITMAGRRYRRAYEYAIRIDQTTVYNQFGIAVERNIARVGRLSRREVSSAKVLDGTALGMDIPDEAVDLVISSPPYCGAQKYVRSFRLELLLLGYTAKQITRIELATLGSERGIWRKALHSAALSPEQASVIDRIAVRNPIRAGMLECYLDGLASFAMELARVLRPGGHAFLTFGVSLFAGISVSLSEEFYEFCGRSGLELTARMVDCIPSRGLITKRHPSASVINGEQLLWLTKVE